jgi:hypothetical protein
MIPLVILEVEFLMQNGIMSMKIRVMPIIGKPANKKTLSFSLVSFSYAY